MKRTRKKSSHVGLVLIGSLALAGCDESPTQRDIYASREDCAADWGQKPTNCEPVRDARTGMWHYYSPGYAYGSRPSNFSGGTSRAVGTSVSRGGFGSSGHAHGASAGS
jgi:uncharacterized protein YgiB involved in biofilm formation